MIEIEVTDIENFRTAVEECSLISLAEPGTLLYDWYLDDVTSTARLYEAYESVEAVIAHTAGPVFTEVGPRLLGTCSFARVDCFGPAERLAASPQFFPVTYWGNSFSSGANVSSEG